MEIKTERYKEIEGDLIQLAKNYEFDVIVQGVNCFCTQKSGLASQMVEAFKTDRFSLEKEIFKGDINKLGQIDYCHLSSQISVGGSFINITQKELTIVNAYTQYNIASEANPDPLDYEALTLCLRKINYKFKGRFIGLPKIGCGLARGNWEKVKEIIKKELKGCFVTIVLYKNEKNT